MSQVQLDLAGVIQGKRRANFKFKVALLELIDNSVDANASKVHIRLDGSDLHVEDDGDGFEDIEVAAQIGASPKAGVAGNIGRYGMGMKDATVRFSDTTVISSKGKMLSIPWADISNGLTEEFNDPIDIEDDGWTHIVLKRFTRIYRQPLTDDHIRKVYAPRLKDGNLKISINGKELEPLDQPSYSDEIDEEFEFRGRMVRLTGGIFDAIDPNGDAWGGYNPYYQGRLIGNGKITKIGIREEACLGYNFNLELINGDEPWVLSTNKDGLDGDDLDALVWYCYDNFTRKMLEHGAKASMTIELKSIIDAANEALGNQTRRKGGGKKGTVKPTGKGKPKKRTNTKTGVGKYESRSCGGANIRFNMGTYLDSRLGRCALQGGSFMFSANLNNKFISDNKNEVQTLVVIAKLAYSAWKAISDNGDDTSDETMESIMSIAGLETS